MLLIRRHVRLREEMLVELLVLELAFLFKQVHKSHAAHFKANVMFFYVVKY